jgi:hypothetical protein
VWRYIVAALLAGLADQLILSRFSALTAAPGAAGAALRIAFVCLSFVGLYLAAIVLLYGGVSPLQRLIGLLREMVPSGGRAPISGAVDGVESADRSAEIAAANVTESAAR